tara:strand:- start:786 stop:2801 length:2016 start_codon:yes stop_codon:yes gene_type:complete
MPSTVYKGDLTEVSFGHETGLKLKHNYAGSNFAFSHKSTDANANTSVIEFSGGAAATPCVNNFLLYPVGMLVGSRISIIGVTNFTADDSHNTGRTYTIMEHKNEHGVGTQLTVTPALKTTTSTAANANQSSTNDVLYIESFGTPTFDANMGGWSKTAKDSSERVLTDQFLGLAATLTLPETKVDLKRYHIVGLGRDTAIQVPGRFLNEGGSFEVNMHNPRWLYYCLGMESVSVSNQFDGLTSVNRTLNGSVEKGETVITLSGGAEFTSVANDGNGTSAVAAGDYIVFLDSNVEDIVTFKEAGDLGASAAFGAAGVTGTTYFDQTQKKEIRRIAAINGNTVFLDDGLCYAHETGVHLRFIRYNGNGGGATKTGSPHRESTGALTNGVRRLLYSRDALPSFALEVSIRRRDVDGADADVTDNGPSDPKQLTRVFKGCKVKDFSMTADTDAALRLTVNFDSALCYTDTGRLESGASNNYSAGEKGDRYKTHRMFEETAGDLVGRKEAGIEKGTQKPFMFYNGTVSIAGITVGQVVSFTLSGNTGVQQFYTINGAAVTDSATDQIPFGGARNASLAVEGKTEYSMDCEIIVDDPVFYHKLRRTIDHEASTANMIRLSFTKPGTASGREQLDILIDDFYITEAPLPIPEDKGVIRAPLKILPKAIRIVSFDTLLHC